MQLIPLNIEAVAQHGATHVAIVTHADLTETTANTAQVIALIAAPANTVARVVKVKNVIPFKDASDAALNTTALTIGDAGDADRLLASTELNVNGTEVLLKQGPVNSNLATVATADGSDAGTTQTLANALKAAFNVLVGLLNVGPGHVYASATTINATFGSMADKSLSNIDTGEAHIYLNLQTYA
jgi:hypothetical protein